MAKAECDRKMGDRKMKKGFGGVLLVGVAFLGIASCGSQQPVVEKKEGPKETVKQSEEKGAKTPDQEKKEEWIAEKPKRDVAAEWKALAAIVSGHLTAGKLGEAQ